MLDRNASATPPRPLGFDVLRIAAAAIVVVSHGYLLPTGTEPYPLVFGDYGYTWGRLGVIVFFCISGYLICGSWLSRPVLRDFAAKRFRRIYPALAAMVLLTALFLGPLLTVEEGYFTDTQTWSFIARNLLVIPYQYSLPGVFEDLPVQAANGVLWTLGVEVIAYCCIVVLGIAGMVRPWVLLVGAVLLSLAGWRWLVDLSAPELQGLSVRLGLIGFFLTAAYLRTRGPHVSGRVTLLWVAVAVVAAALDAPLSILLVPAATLSVLWLGTRTWAPARHVTRWGDPSYGVYIYGFVLQQLLIVGGLGDLPRASFIGLSLALSLVAGYLSWHALELPMTQWRRPPVRREPVTVAEDGG